jgi:hypothetical protein
VLSGKGLTSAANPRGSSAGVPGSGDGQYTGAMLQGSLSILPVPDAATLQAMTKMVYSLTPLTSAGVLAPPSAAGASPIPKKVGDPSPIKHVFYIIRENRRAIDSGRPERGNGDLNLCLFGDGDAERARHRAGVRGARQLYVDAEVSYDGHAYDGRVRRPTSSKIWPTTTEPRRAI